MTSCRPDARGAARHAVADVRDQSGYASDPAQFKLAIILTQISMPYLPCMAIAALLSEVLNAHRRFIVTGIFLSTLLNLVMLIAVVPQHDSDPRRLTAASIGIPHRRGVAGGPAVVGAKKTGARIVLRKPKLSPEIKSLIFPGHSRRHRRQRRADQHLHLRHPGLPGAGRPGLDRRSPRASTSFLSA